MESSIFGLILVDVSPRDCFIYEEFNSVRMRSLSLIVTLFSSVATLLGQGRINFSNASASAEQKVYVDEWLNPSALAPGGGQFLVALYFAPLGADETSLVQVGNPAGFGTDPNRRSGLFLGGIRTVATTIPGGEGIFQVRGWEAAYGTTYEEAIGSPEARRGQSPVFIAYTAHPDTLEVARNLIESSRTERPFRGFVIAVPEPSTGVLLLAGVAAVVAEICRKGRRR